MIRNRLALGLAVAALSTGALASASSASAATVELRKTALGEILTDSQGFTLFIFSHDQKKMNSCIAIEGCPGTWPALTVTGMPTAGPGLNAKKLGTIVLPGGAMQVTYNHRALYRYAGNVGPEETSYVGFFEFGGYWYGMNAKGKRIR